VSGWPVVLALIWLFVVAWQDAHKREVSPWLTVPPLFASAFWWLTRGEWSIGAILAVLLVVGEVFERLHLPAALGIGPVILIAGWLAGQSPQDVRLILTTWACAWPAWTLHLVGGADAKVFMALVAFFPDPLLVGLLLAMQVAWSVYHLVRRYRGQALKVALVGALSQPTEEDLDARGVPLLPAYAAAGAVFFTARSLVEHWVRTLSLPIIGF
jgi:Flp pilus assembly protein protease CpaA